jgi:hypothetical protein
MLLPALTKLVHVLLLLLLLLLLQLFCCLQKVNNDVEELRDTFTNITRIGDNALVAWAEERKGRQDDKAKHSLELQVHISVLVSSVLLCLFQKAYACPYNAGVNAAAVVAGAAIRCGCKPLAGLSIILSKLHCDCCTVTAAL